MKRKSGSLPAASPEVPSIQLLHLQDEERRLIARLLHDTVGQNMAALQMNLSLISETAVRADVPSHQALTNCVALAQSCVREIRSLSYALYPPLLDELGLLTALRAYAEDYSRRTNADLTLDFPDDMDRLEPGVEIALFRLAQAGLENMRVTTLRIRRIQTSVILELAGPGYAPATQFEERVHRLGGDFSIQTGADSTTLRMTLPIAIRASTA